MQNRITTCNEYVNLQNDIQLIVNIMQRHETAITMNVNYTLKICNNFDENRDEHNVQLPEDWKRLGNRFPTFSFKESPS